MDAKNVMIQELLNVSDLDYSKRHVQVHNEIECSNMHWPPNVTSSS